MPLIVDGTSGVTFNDSSLQGAAASPFGLKNRIINGDMVIDQRNNGASIASSATTFTVDRWRHDTTGNASFTYQRNAGSVTPPTGFTNYLGCTSTAAYTPANNTTHVMRQYIEGFNIADLAWGTANARTVTVSFWVRSSLTGNFTFSVQNGTATRSYVTTYTISAANTWEYKTITIDGDTTGTWATNNTGGMIVSFNLGTGSGTYATNTTGWQAGQVMSLNGTVQVSATNGATWYLTGVQLERNTTATPFEWLPISTELALCQRYFYKSTNAVSGGSAYNVISLAGFNSTRCFGTFSLPVSLRASPTITFNGCAIRDGALSIQATVTNIFPVQTVTTIPFSASVPCEFNVASGLSSNVWYGLGFISTGNDFYALSAEL